MMAVLKRCYVLPLAALLVLSIDPTAAEVVESMSDCAEFLLDETPPRVPGILEGGNILNPERYKPICQTLNNRRHFVTLYDTENKIPVFSAYKYTGDDGSKRPGRLRWNIEPQLENMQDGKNMKVPDKSKTYDHQAVDCDYKYTRGFDRGHLFPSSYGYNLDDKKSTFTLTNIVPQEGQFNKGRWNNMEQCIKCVLDQYCSDMNNNINGFLVTGAKPGNNILKNRINIPSMLWSAFCCYSRSEMKRLASAHWGENVQDASAYLQTKTLEELRSKLGIEVFPRSRCPGSTTVTELYPQVNAVNRQCKCPPTISTTSAPSTATLTPSISTSAPLETGPPSTTSALPSSTKITTTTTTTTTTTKKIKKKDDDDDDEDEDEDEDEKEEEEEEEDGEGGEEQAEDEGGDSEPSINENGEVPALSTPAIGSPLADLKNLFNGLLGGIASLGGAIGTMLGSLSGAKTSDKSSPSINRTPIATSSKSSDTPHPNNEDPVALAITESLTTMSATSPAIPPKVISASIPATTVSVAAITSTAPPDNMPAVPTNLPKATASEKPTTIHPETATQQSSAIPLTTATTPQTTSNHANSAAAVTSVPLTTTSAPLSSTAGPLSTTSAPLSSTSAPHTTTSANPSSTAGPRSTTSSPFTSASAPLSSTSGPPTTTSALLSSTSVPHTTTSANPSSTAGPRSTTSPSFTTTSAPTSGQLTTSSILAAVTVSVVPQTATASFSGITVTPGSTDPQLTSAPATTYNTKMTTEPSISLTSQDSLSVPSNTTVMPSNTTFPVSLSPSKTNTPAFETTHATNPTLSASLSDSTSSPTSATYRLISTLISSPSSTSIPPTMSNSDSTLSSSSIPCCPRTPGFIFHQYPKIIAYYQSLYQYESNN